MKKQNLLPWFNFDEISCIALFCSFFFLVSSVPSLTSSVLPQQRWPETQNTNVSEWWNRNFGVREGFSTRSNRSMSASFETLNEFFFSSRNPWWWWAVDKNLKKKKNSCQYKAEFMDGRNGRNVGASPSKFSLENGGMRMRRIKIWVSWCLQYFVNAGNWNFSYFSWTRSVCWRFSHFCLQVCLNFFFFLLLSRCSFDAIVRKWRK